MIARRTKRKNFNVALFGLGNFGRNYVRLLADFPGARLHTVVTKSGRKNPDIALPSDTEVTADPKKVWHNSDIDAVIIVTPPANHFALAKAALESGKHVLVEKPMVVGLKEARALQHIVTATGNILAVGHQYLFNPYVRYLKGQLDEKSLGAVFHVISEHLVSPARNDVDAFYDAAPHPLSVMHYLFNPGKIVDVCGFSRRIGGNRFAQTAVATVKFERPPLLTITASWVGDRKTRRLTLVSDRCRATLDETLPDKRLSISESGGIHKPVVAAIEPLRAELEHFFACIRTGTQPLASVKLGVIIAGWLETISRSIR